MWEYIGQIKGYLEDLQQKSFTGGIKMVFEEGVPRGFWISSVSDFKNKPVEEGFDLQKILVMATDNSFSGSLSFIFEKGEIKHFYYTETIQGKQLLDKLCRYRVVSRSTGKRVAIRKK